MGVPVNVPFNSNMPLSTDNPSNSQSQFLTNNQSLNQLVPVDHYGFGNNLGGWHNVIHIPQISGNANPPPTTVPQGAGQIYTRTVGGQINLFYEDASANVYQLTPNTPPPSYPIVRAAVVFNAGALPSLFNSFNISSVVRNSVGNYTINFTSPTTNFYNYVSAISNSFHTSLSATSTTSVLILTSDINGNPFDPSLVSVTVIS